MTLTQLKYFCETCRCHSITGAANELYVTQPAISLAIKELEAEFDITLFTRINNKLSLTEDGARFYERASYILQYCNDMQFELSSLGKNKQPLRVGIPPILSSIFFPGMLDAYQKEYPDYYVSLIEYGSVRACKMIMDEQLDLALVNMEMYNVDQLDSQILLHDQLVFCAAKNHHLADRETVIPEDFDNENIILFNKDSVQNAMLRSRFDSHGVTPNIIMQGSQLYTIINFLRTGNVGCFLYSSTMAGLLKFKAIPLDPPIKTDIGIVWKKGRHLSTQMQSFIQFSTKYYN